MACQVQVLDPVGMFRKEASVRRSSFWRLSVRLLVEPLAGMLAHRPVATKKNHQLNKNSRKTATRSAVAPKRSLRKRASSSCVETWAISDEM